VIAEYLEEIYPELSLLGTTPRETRAYPHACPPWRPRPSLVRSPVSVQQAIYEATERGLKVTTIRIVEVEARTGQ